MKLLAVILIAIGAWAQSRVGPQILWPGPLSDSAMTNMTLNSAASGGYSQSQYAMGFIATGSRQLSKAHVNVASITGTLGSSDFCAGLYSDSGAKPNASVEIRCSTDSAAAAGTVSVNGFTSTASTTRGTAYHLVVLNANATPASNYPTGANMSLTGSGDAFGAMANSSSGQFGGLTFNSTTDGGTTWTKAARIACIVLEWSDGTKEGWPCANVTASAFLAYGSPAREGGMLIQTGAQPMRVVGVAAMAYKALSPTGALRFRIYSGSGSTGRVLLGTTDSQPAANVSTARNYMAEYFADPIIIPAFTWISIVIGNSATDSASNYFRASSVQLMPTLSDLWFRWSPSAPKTTATTDGGTTWTDTSNEFGSFALILDPARPFLQIGGGFSQ